MKKILLLLIISISLISCGKTVQVKKKDRYYKNPEMQKEFLVEEVKIYGGLENDKILK